MTDDKQLERFKQAVEDKNEEARRRAGEADAPAPQDEAKPPEPQDPQDEQEQRAKSSRHGQVTADNWNQ